MQMPSSSRLWRFSSLTMLLLPAALGVDGRLDAAAAVTGLAMFDLAGQQPRPAPAPAASAEKGERIVVSFSRSLASGLAAGRADDRRHDHPWLRRQGRDRRAARPRGR